MLLLPAAAARLSGYSMSANLRAGACRRRAGNSGRQPVLTVLALQMLQIIGTFFVVIIVTTSTPRCDDSDDSDDWQRRTTASLADRSLVPSTFRMAGTHVSLLMRAFVDRHGVAGALLLARAPRDWY